ncbi:MAG: autotransporter outer membrane beta-barrel domain-containing protein [Planctomycetes bacterium]|nr:autotransporter outer membrane beta-barrel domain-containing protein [Planctomycetota bacterium]
MRVLFRGLLPAAAVLFWTVTASAAAMISVSDNATYANLDAGVTGSSLISGATTEMVSGGVVGSAGNGHSIFGGRSTGGNVVGCILTITGGRVWVSTSGSTSTGGIAAGGIAYTGSTNNNAVIMSGGQVDDEVWGGWSTDDATNNRVTISGTAVIGANGGWGDVTGGLSRDGTADNNHVVIEGGTILGEVVGGRSDSSTSDHAASNNSVTISGGSIGESIIGGAAANGAATGNAVIMTGGSVLEHVVGGYSDSGAATGNTVTITGGTIGENIVGGYTDNGDATGNTVRLGAATVSATTQILGGYSETPGNDVKTGNTLYLTGFRGSVNQINNFEHYNFHLPASLADGDTLVTITGGVSTDMTDSTVDGIFIDGTSSLVSSHSVTLISNATGTFAATTIQAAKGTTLLLDATVELVGGELIATFGDASPTGGGGGVSVNPQGKALAQSRIAGLTMLGQGADLVADDLFVSAAAGQTYREDGAGPVFFSAFSYADQRVKTGSHVDADGWSLLAGLAWRANAEGTGWLAGAFFETGRGSYDGYNSFSTAPQVHSSGDVKYHGGGVIGSYRFVTGTRIEASFRAGRLDTDYRARGFVGGVQPRYDLDSTYYGSHVGIGQVVELTRCLNLDLSAKYLWTRQAGKSVAIVGERTRFEGVDSQRLRAGGRLGYAGAVVSPYVGAYFEYEFDGKARTANRVTGVRYSSPTTRGATYTGQLGVRFTPVRCLDVDLAVQGHCGRRDGVSGRLGLGLSF